MIDSESECVRASAARPLAVTRSRNEASYYRNRIGDRVGSSLGTRLARNRWYNSMMVTGGDCRGKRHKLIWAVLAFSNP